MLSGAYTCCRYVTNTTNCDADVRPDTTVHATASTEKSVPKDRIRFCIKLSIWRLSMTWYAASWYAPSAVAKRSDSNASLP